MATDIKLGDNHDLDLSSGDLSLFTRVEDLAVQQVKINLLVYKGEWFLDVDKGVPYLQEIFGDRNTKAAADSNIKYTILNTDNIQSILSYSSSVNNINRTLLVECSARTNSGEIINIEVEI